MVRRRPNRSRAQLVLELERRVPEPPIERSTKGLVETLADLLLEALGTGAALGTGGADEQQDHA